MKITLLISTYNRPDLLGKALLSAAAQSRPPDEVVVADDGSREDMVGALRLMKSSLPFPIRYVTQADDGFRLARARNNGVRVASGDLVVSSDQDIVFSNRYLETFENAARPGRFLVSYPVRLDQAQTERLSGAPAADSVLEEVIREEQRALVRKQWRKDTFYSALKTLRLRRIGPKLRGGVFAVWRSDFVAVNGFDENYRGWGNEDDDLGHRLGAFGVTGLNPFRDQYPVHLWHPTNSQPGNRPNRAYYRERLKAIARGEYRAVNGLANPLGEDPPVVIEI